MSRPEVSRCKRRAGFGINLFSNHGRGLFDGYHAIHDVEPRQFPPQARPAREAVLPDS
jgi:hypothetical protein